MARNRRQQLARTLAEATGMTYQQALARLEEHVAVTGQLPRTDAELAALAEADTGIPVARPDAGLTGLVSVSEVTRPLSFVIKYSDLGRCPHLVLSVGHYLTTGECAHASPSCPTCAGVGRLSGGAGVVACGDGAGLPRGVPVCEGTGTWTGQRAGDLDEV